MGQDIFWEELEKSLPAVFPRKAVPALLGGLLAAGTMANLDSSKRGPAVKVRVGKFVGYEKASFLAWLKSRSKNP